MSNALILMLAVMGGTMLLRAPISFGMLAGGVAYLIAKGQDVGLMAEQVLNGLYNSYVLLAVPLFILAASIMNAGAISERLFAMAIALVGHFRGGLAYVNVIVSVIFSGMSGSAIADAAGPGLVSMRMMTDKKRFTPEFAGALTACSSTIGPIIPPSIPMVIYALVSGSSVGALFLGGVVPGFLMAFSLMVGIYILGRIHDFPREERTHFRDMPKVVLQGFLPLTLPIVLLGGIYSGVFTPTEAAAVAAMHAILLTIYYRSLTWQRMWHVLQESLRQSASVTLIVASAFIMNYAIASEQIPDLVAQWFTQHEFTKLQFLLLANLVFLVLGCFLDTSTMLLVLVPLLIPSAKIMGVDLVHFGVVVVVNMMIGLVTPPFGMLLFVINALTGTSLKGMIRQSLPFMALLLISLLLMTLFPQIVLWLPQSMGYATQ
ncbi:TRAP transporter large permease [Propionivibrio limicola]|uniref:TRAP transporter large permease n=1 Tax=Propionivibrio limicola TaxID=167645 RepID=UPI0012914792|nr:TRAP transporter large permease [Propionivibrio limicola]